MSEEALAAGDLANEEDDELSYGPFFEWLSFWRNVKHRNRFHLSKEAHRLLAGTIDLIRKHRSSTLAAGDVLVRCRVHEPFDDRTPPKANVQQIQPYSDGAMGAPPPEQCRSGRLNPEGIPYLYLADSVETALAELRPWRGASVSAATFVLTRPVRVADFNLPKADSGDKKNIWLHFVGRAISIPQHPQDPLAYVPTQFLAELLKAEGFERVRYASAMRDEGVNTALFQPEAARFELSWVVRVENASYTFK